MGVEAVVFDLGNTLFTATETGDRDERWEARLGLRPGTMSRDIWGSPMERSALTGEVGFADFWTWVGETLGLNEQQLMDLDDGMWEGIVLLPQVRSLLRRLKSRTRVAVLSNAWSDARGRTEGVDGFGILQLVEFIVYSAEIGFAKPDPRAFAVVLDRLGVQPSQALFVDDLPINVAAAAALGMQAVRCVDADQMIRAVESVTDPPAAHRRTTVY